MDGTNKTTTVNASSSDRTAYAETAHQNYTTSQHRHRLMQHLPTLQPTSHAEYFYENQQPYADHRQNCLLFSAVSYPYAAATAAAAAATGAATTATAAANAAATTATAAPNNGKRDDNCIYYQLTNNVHSYRWYVSKMAHQQHHQYQQYLHHGHLTAEQQPLQPTSSNYSRKTRSIRNARHLSQQLHDDLEDRVQTTQPTQSLPLLQHHHLQQQQQQHEQQQEMQHLQEHRQQLYHRGHAKEWTKAKCKEEKVLEEGYGGGGGGVKETGGGEASSIWLSFRSRLSNKMHPVQLLHQIFRKEAFVMEYERINDGPFSRVRVTYKVNGKCYAAEATRLKEARRLCAKKVLRDQFPQLEIESDDDIPCAEYDVQRFDNKHPVQILYQIFRYEPMEMHCEEEGAAHFAKHIFTFVIRGTQYQAKAETIKEAKRRAAILALNEYFKRLGTESPPLPPPPPPPPATIEVAAEAAAAAATVAAAVTATARVTSATSTSATSLAEPSTCRQSADEEAASQPIIDSTTSSVELSSAAEKICVV